ncbi:hypothetical protein GM658_21630 [Pseudoduganella eburnea]|uniref:Lipoprotein n=1 Tax=Massilia eburnea TaxID=1776165 RepID=A0A6L6QM39_9BURK|nr:hypothetical protein [Massilia eburnea]MTW13211.1 hypothetical protein [Massilia eburnea]
MRYVFALLASFILAGCATTTTRLPVENLAVSAKAPVEDLRPAAEGTREIFSLMITSDQYGYARLAQEITDPTGARLFSHRLQEKFASTSVPQTKLYHFAVYLNNRSELRKVALGAGFGGLIGAAIMSNNVVREGDVVHTMVNEEAFNALSGDKEYQRAFYTELELKQGTSAFVIYIESEADGQRRFTRTVSPIKPAQPGEKIPLHQAMEAAIQFHLKS